MAVIIPVITTTLSYIDAVGEGRMIQTAQGVVLGKATETGNRQTMEGRSVTDQGPSTPLMTGSNATLERGGEAEVVTATTTQVTLPAR